MRLNGKMDPAANYYAVTINGVNFNTDAGTATDFSDVIDELLGQLGVCTDPAVDGKVTIATADDGSAVLQEVDPGYEFEVTVSALRPGAVTAADGTIEAQCLRGPIPVVPRPQTQTVVLTDPFDMTINGTVLSPPAAWIVAVSIGSMTTTGGKGFERCPCPLFPTVVPTDRLNYSQARQLAGEGVFRAYKVRPPPRRRVAGYSNPRLVGPGPGHQPYLLLIRGTRPEQIEPKAPDAARLVAAGLTGSSPANVPRGV